MNRRAFMPIDYGLNYAKDDVMLTTVDNRYNPFTQWDEWLREDIYLGHGTMEALASAYVRCSGLSESAQEDAIDLAIDEVIRANVTGVFRRIKPDGTFVSEKLTEPLIRPWPIKDA